MDAVTPALASVPRVPAPEVPGIPAMPTADLPAVLRQAVAPEGGLAASLEPGLFSNLVSNEVLESLGDLLDGLTALLDHSLLTQSTDADDEPRFRMLETLREYAAEQLAALRDAGVSRVLCQHLLHDDLDAVALIGERLAPAVA